MNPQTNEQSKGEQPSTTRQWTERSGAPIATRAMTKTEIEEHKTLLMQRFGYTNRDDMKWEFSKIQDEKDNDRDDCLWLKYFMKVEAKGQMVWRECFTLKIPIPDKLRKTAEAMRAGREFRPRQRATKPMALPSAQGPSAPAPAGVYVPPMQADTTEADRASIANAPAVVRPRARKPVVKK
jgi:hypothetical protein